jgi:DNA-binding transcriptional LysR family regulator
MAISPEHWEARIGRRLRIRDLHVFITAIHCGSMAKAARQLAISQPAVSKAVNDLEHVLGVRLLDRGSAGISATSYGSALVRRSLAAFDELRQAVRDIEFIANPEVGDVRMGCNESLSVALIPAVIEQLSREHPGINLHLSPMSRPITQDIRHLRERSIDLIVGRGVFRIPEDDLDVDVLFEEPLIVVTGVKSVWARRRKLALGDLGTAKWIMYPPEEAPGTLVDQAFREQGVAMPRASVTTNSFHLRGTLLANGDYVTVVPACMLRVFNAEKRAVAALPIDLRIPIRPVAIFTLKNRTLSPVVGSVIRCIHAVAAKVAVPWRSLATRNS